MFLALFSLVLEEDKLDYWALFVKSLHILLNRRIDRVDLLKADRMVYEFVALTEENFGAAAMTYNIHLLTHISKSVSDWGPLWAISAFSFETANHYTLQAISNAKGALLQIHRSINLSNNLSILEKRVIGDASEIVKKFCDTVIRNKIKNVVKVSGNVTYLGKGERISEEISQRYELTIENLCHILGQ